MESCDELIIIDNNSTDGTKEYLTTLPVRVVMLEKNYYPGFAANIGWSMADKRAKYLHRSDNDILYLPKWKEHVENVFEAFGGLGQFGLLDRKQRLLKKDWAKEEKLLMRDGMTVNLFYPTVGGNCVIPADLFRGGLGWNEKPWVSQNCEDVRMSREIAKRGLMVAGTQDRIALHLAEGRYNEDYYTETFKVRKDEETLSIFRQTQNQYKDHQRI